MSGSFDDILEANDEYARGFTLGGLTAPAARGLGVLTCIDSRIEPLAMLGLRAGDAKIFRNAGARATDDAIRSLVLATNLLAVRRVMVVAHTDCAMTKTTDEALRERLQLQYPGADLEGLEFHASPAAEVTLARDVERVRSCALIPDDVVVSGFVYDVATGRLRQVID